MNALDLLTARLFDYAGTFPPASLDLKSALAESARAARLERPHIVGTDIVVDSSDLRLVTPKALASAGFGDTQCAIALVGIDAVALKRTVPRVQKFNDKNLGIARITSLEVDGRRFETTALQAAREELADVRLYVEPHITDRGWAASGWSLVEMLGRLARIGVPVGLKVRGSGPRAISTRSLAQLIPQLITHNVGLKVTAGMHHPILEREWRNHVGFVNTAAALRLRQALGAAFDAEAILGCLNETAADAFAFDGELVWRAHAVPEDRLGEVMDKLPFTVGTCDVREPDQDLVRLFGAP